MSRPAEPGLVRAPLALDAVRAAAAAPRRIAILGNPNAGKSTLFNALTGLRQKVGNYPGVTVEKKMGACTRPRPTSASCATCCWACRPARPRPT